MENCTKSFLLCVGTMSMDTTCSGRFLQRWKDIYNPLNKFIHILFFFKMYWSCSKGLSRLPRPRWGISWKWIPYSSTICHWIHDHLFQVTIIYSLARCSIIMEIPRECSRSEVQSWSFVIDIHSLIVFQDLYVLDCFYFYEGRDRVSSLLKLMPCESTRSEKARRFLCEGKIHEKAN